MTDFVLQKFSIHCFNQPINDQQFSIFHTCTATDSSHEQCRCVIYNDVFDNTYTVLQKDIQEVDFFFVADDAFGSDKHIVKPFKGANLGEDVIRTNLRISRLLKSMPT